MPLCTPCIQERKITPEMLAPMAQPVKAARAVMEILKATNVMPYFNLRVCFFDKCRN